jgi:hypothetical protein
MVFMGSAESIDRTCTTSAVRQARRKWAAAAAIAIATAAARSKVFIDSEG